METAKDIETKVEEKEQQSEQKIAPVQKKKQVAEKTFVIEVKDNPGYCGIGAGGVQFANGKAEIKSERMAEWFREHDGYIVK